MESIELQVEIRPGGRSSSARRLRQGGKTPGVFYGPKRQPTLLAVDAKEFRTKVAAVEGSHLIRFRCDAEEVHDRVALVKEAQYHPVTGEVLHADFYEVDMAEKLRVRVPLHFTGKAIGTTLGGILQPILRDIEVECLPGDIPEFIAVDVTPLNVHDAIHIGEIPVPPAVTVCGDGDSAVVTVLPPTVEEVKVAEEAPAEAEAAAVAAEGAKPEGEKPEKAEKKGGTS